MYLLTDGRLVEFSIDTWSLEKGSLLEPRCIYYPPYYGYEWMIENSEAGHGRYDYGLPPKWR